MQSASSDKLIRPHLRQELFRSDVISEGGTNCCRVVLIWDLSFQLVILRFVLKICAMNSWYWNS